MRKHCLKWLVSILIVIGIASSKGYAENLAMTQLEKNVQNEHRYRNLSTAPSALKVQIMDHKGKEIINAIVRNDDMFLFLLEQNVVSNPHAYVAHMIRNDGTPIVLDMQIFMKFLATKWGEKAVNAEKFFFDHNLFEKPATFDQLGVENEMELIHTFFDFNFEKSKGTLKSKYFDVYTRNPSFIALLIDLGYDVVWGDYIPNLNIYAHPFITA